MENLRWRQAHSSYGLTWITTTQILEEIFDNRDYEISSDKGEDSLITIALVLKKTI